MLKDFADRRKQEKEVRDQKRLPPGQSLTLKFPILHYGPVPVYESLEDWTFKIWGLVEDEVELSWKEFTSLPTRSVQYDLHCVTRWSKFDTAWEGVHLQDMINEGVIKLKPEAKFCVQHCEYGYTVNLPITAMLQDNFIFAYKFEGNLIEPEHGYPVRGLMGAIPEQSVENDRYLWKGGKWIRGIEFLAQDKLGFWENAGYNNSANIWREERFTRSF